MRINALLILILVSALSASQSIADKCIDSPERYACTLAGCQGDTLPLGIIRGQLPDADSDGTPEALITFQTACNSTECVYQVFLSNKGCFTHAGQITGKSFSLLKTQHHGKLDIEGSSGEKGAYQAYQLLYEYDGKQYKLKSKQLVLF